MTNRTYHQRGALVHGFNVEAHPLYRTWAAMLERCYNPACPEFHNYGGRGIVVVEQWHHFMNFANDMGLKPSPELTLERMDNSLGYSPSNCTWETRSNQCVNRRVFKNNTSGFTGVVRSGISWVARFDYEKVRYNIGWFASREEAVVARNVFVELFFFDKAQALSLMPCDKARHTSSTGVRGVTPHVDGGYTVRVTQNNARLYLGYFKTFTEACDARQKFIAG